MNAGLLAHNKHDIAMLEALTHTEQVAKLGPFNAVCNACIERRFFSTTGGRIDLGPFHTQPGDQICIFYGGYTPSIIRPQPQPLDSTCEEFIGEASVHGIMEGETMVMEDRKPDEMVHLI